MRSLTPVLRAVRRQGHAEPASCVCFAPGEQYALSAADDRHLSLWHASPATKPPEPADACVQTFALDSRLVQLGFQQPAPSAAAAAAHLAFYGLTATGRLCVWRLPTSPAPKPGDPPPLPTAAQCTVRKILDETSAL